MASEKPARAKDASWRCVSFGSVWDVLYEEQFPNDFIKMMMNLYNGQRGRVRGQEADGHGRQ